MKCNFRFSTSAFLTRTYIFAVSKMLFGETLFFKKTEFQNCNFCFENHFCVPHWRIIPKQSTLFWGEQNLMKKTFSPKYNFCSLSSVNRTTTDNNVILKLLLKKHFQGKLFCLKTFSFLSSFLCTPIDESFQTNQFF